jgi:hypothetical protein
MDTAKKHLRRWGFSQVILGIGHSGFLDEVKDGRMGGEMCLKI